MCLQLTARCGASAADRRGVISCLTSFVADRGVSVASAKRNQVEDVFSLMIAVWIPPRRPNGLGISPDAFAPYLLKLAATDPRTQGLDIQVLKVSPVAADATTGGETRRLRVEAPQKPGLMTTISKVRPRPRWLPGCLSP